MWRCFMKNELKTVEPTNLVAYDNVLNEINFAKFTSTDLDFFMCVLSAVANEGTTIVQIPLNEIKVMTGYEQKGDRFRTDLKSMNKKLLSLNTEIIKPNGDEDQFVLFTRFTTNKDKAYLEVKINEEYTFLLNELARQFTELKLSEFVSLKSKYSKNLYRILRQYDNAESGWFRASVEDIRNKLDIPKSYSNKHIMDKAIKPAIKDLSQFFPKLQVDVIRARRQGAPVRGYEFRWQPFVNEDMPGQISFTSTQEFDALTKDLNNSEKAQAIKIGADIIKGKEKNKKVRKNTFTDFHQREVDYDEYEKMFLLTNKNVGK